MFDLLESKLMLGSATFQMYEEISEIDDAGIPGFTITYYSLCQKVPKPLLILLNCIIQWRYLV